MLSINSVEGQSPFDSFLVERGRPRVSRFARNGAGRINSGSVSSRLRIAGFRTPPFSPVPGLQGSARVDCFTAHSSFG